MEYIISQDAIPSGELYEDETYCTRGLCTHPSCWESHIRQTRGFKRYVTSAINTSEESTSFQVDKDNYGLATMKVLNMLDDYGSSSKDVYPSQHKGRPLHKHQTDPATVHLEDKDHSSKAPAASAPLGKTKLVEGMLHQPHTDATVKQVEVQEVFDLEELSQNWDSTFIPKPVYVWVPNKSKRKGKKSKIKSSTEKRGTQQDSVAMKDITNEMLPRGYGHPHTAPAQTIRQPVIPRSKSPIPTGGQPYQNVGQTPKDRMRFQVIMNELKDLPRPFVIEVLEKARGMEKKEDVLLLMERYLKTMKKSDWELSMVTGKVLQQQRLSRRLLQHAERLPAVTSSKIYKLDEARYDDSIDTEMMSVPAEVMEASMGTANKYRPLPGIGEPRKKKKNPVRVHVSTTTQESVKPFQYKKQSDLEFCLGPTRSFSVSRPASDGTTQSVKQPTIPGGDMSVLYDQASIERNANNNAITDITKRTVGSDSTRNIIGPSPMLPTAPAGTPYSPKTPNQAKQIREFKTDMSHSSPEGAVRFKLSATAYPILSRTFTLEVIQEMAVVNEFAQNQNQVGRDCGLTTRSVIEARTAGPPSTRRVVSANSPRVRAELRRRVNSAGPSMALQERSSVGQQDLETVVGTQPGRVTTSRLEIVSTTSNWPNVDEEALLREQATPNLNRVPSAASKQSRDSLRKSNPQSTVTKEGEPQVRSIVVDMPPLKQLENSPAPPPPSPEPADRPKAIISNEKTAGTNESEAQDHKDQINIVPGEHQKECKQVAPTDANERLTGIVPHNSFSDSVQSHTNLIGQPDNLVPRHSESASGEEVGQSELEQKLRRDMELQVQNPTEVDSLSLVPNKLYSEMDLDREVSLSATPPTALNTPELSLLHTKPQLPPSPKGSAEPTEVPSLAANESASSTTDLVPPKNEESKAAENESVQRKLKDEEPCPTPDVAAVMRPDDEGGLFG